MIRFLYILSLIFVSVIGVYAAVPEADNSSVRILVVPSSNNLVSPHYPQAMIAQEMQLNADSLVWHINSAIGHALQSADNKFVFHNHPIELTSATDQLPTLLRATHTHYLLCIDSYEIIHQEKPFATVFHNVNYSLYSPQMKKIFSSKNHFNTYSLEVLSSLNVPLSKCSKKIASAVTKAIL